MTSSCQYFNKLSQALKEAKIYAPCLLIDQERLDHNIEQVRQSAPARAGLHMRIVVKSLPSIPLLKYVASKFETNRFMSFHIPFISFITQNFSDADILLGKPMPVGGAEKYYRDHTNENADITWLIDTPKRLDEYENLAMQLGKVLRVNFEINIGLNRGGFEVAQIEVFREAIRRADASEHLEIAGLMGYEPFISAVPRWIASPEKSFKSARDNYHKFRQQVTNIIGTEQAKNLIYNTGGSSTYAYYTDEDPANEISFASGLVKPTDFDKPSLTNHKPAVFIATPVLKIIDNPSVPMAPKLSAIFRFLGLQARRACYIYGGNWLAKPCYPEQSKRNALFGHSSNQELYDIPTDFELNTDDYFFFRPTQSEAVFLQFGDIAVFDGQNITTYWHNFYTTPAMAQYQQ